MRLRIAAGIVGAGALVMLAACGSDGANGDWDAAEADWEQTDEQAAGELEAEEIAVFQGGEHCGWESVRFLEFHSESDGVSMQFIRDPNGNVRTDPLPESFEESVERPDDATFTGWNTGDREVWVGNEREYAYVGTDEDSERWATTPYTVGCD